MKKNRCPVCHSSVKENFLRNYDADGNNKMFVYDKCNDCGLVWISSVTDKNELNDYYYDSYYGGRQGLVTKIRDIFKYFVNKSRYHLIRKYKISGIVLDCGCGNGDFIKYLSTYTDFTVYGQDISLSSETEIKKRELDIQYYNTDLLDMEFTDYFDVITLWAVFEHVTNPAEYLKKLYGMLKKDGYLVIQVQNIDSWQASLNLADWFHFDTPRHVYNYTPYNLSVFKKKNGFSIREIKHFSIEHGIFGWFQTTS